MEFFWKKIGRYLMIPVVGFFLWIITRPYLDPIFYDFETITFEDEVDLKVRKYYNNRGLGYLNNQYFLHGLVSDEGQSILFTLKRNARLYKHAHSDTIFVDVDGTTHIFRLEEEMKD